MSRITPAEAYQIWDRFLEQWPLEHLDKMSLEEYTFAGDTSTFTYWIESETEALGSIWGGSAFKFGIYSRRNKSPRTNNARATYNDIYGWGTKYGATPDVAFEAVRTTVAEIARAARSGDLNAIDQANLGVATKWKIAFLYQDRNNPCVLPLYREESLRIVSGAVKTASPASMHKSLLADRNDSDIFEYGRQVWEKASKLLAEQWSGQRALQILQEHEDLVPYKESTDKIAGFKLDDDRQLALDLSAKTPALYLQPGNWLEIANHFQSKAKEYAPEDSRNSNLQANAPQLAQGNAAIKISVSDEEALYDLLAAYLELSSKHSSSSSSGSGSLVLSKQPLNQILFGPPGTGKTYNTVNKSLAILAPEYLAQHNDDRAALKERFDQLLQQDRIRFITFHQSFSYEDFVEGLSASVDKDSKQLNYEVVDGVFKSFCIAAAAKVTQRAEAPTDLGKRRVWKMSLGNTLGEDASIYDECIAGDYVLLGYGDGIDFTGCKSRQDVQERFAAAGVMPENPSVDYGITSVTTFSTRVAKGDLVVVTDGNFKFRAVGEITGDYEFKAHADYEDGYSQLRSVRWLRQYQPSLPHTELMNSQFSQMTLYELRSPALDREKLHRLLSEEEHLATEDPSSATSFQIGQVFGKDYSVLSVSSDILELKKPNGKQIGLAMNMLRTLAAYVREGRIDIEDIRAKKVFEKVPESLLEPYLVHGYNNVLPQLVEHLLQPSKILTPSTVSEDISHPVDARVVIIDEINRGNISRIFGELITLIEPSKRAGGEEALSVTLPYSKKAFTVPSNVYIIGTMNTADRSLAGMDIALRRRFMFKEMPPRPDLLVDIHIEGVSIHKLLQVMNQRIEVLLDRDHCLGHSYFLSLHEDRSLTRLAGIFRNQILPLLQEYFFEDWQRISWVLNDQAAIAKGSHPFIQRPPSEQSLHKLFGNEVASQLNDQRWQLNEVAFTSIESYRNILDEMP
ncbi:AAA family ATPase [Vreelandella zhanjiangensis]|uniref:AAA family ATPase n=1 Tax=Vreelandella zhanjiangensis TaxID=1121960 RepID=UPI00037C9166|nr:AAA family ATPase [Halomonas zhanjiangensis]